MLDERDEGLFGWYTVNFLLDKLHNISESIVTLDLGGGSTQVTFSTNDIHTLVSLCNAQLLWRSALICLCNH